MRNAWLVAVCLAVVAATPRTAGAQDTPKTGIVIGFPTAVGILWHASDKVALRPEFAVSGSSSDISVGATTGTTASHTTSWGGGCGVSALFYLHTDDKLRTYIVPRFAWTHSSSSSDVSPISGTFLDVSTDTYGGSGSFGAQYGLGNRFALFGELGLEVAHHTTNRTLPSTGNSWGTRAGVGVVLYP